MPRKKKETWPKVVVGNHLTVTTHENGKTELKWDDEALAKEIHEALEAYTLSQKTPNVKAKSTTRTKKVKA